MDTVRAANRALAGRPFRRPARVYLSMTDTINVAAARAEQAGPGASGRVLTVLLTSVAYFMVALDTLVVVTALPSIHRDLGGNVGTLQWTVNAYVLAFGAGIITAAALGDLIGRRRMYLLGLCVFTRGLGRLRAGPQCRGADRLPRRRGRRRRHHHAARPDPADLGLPGRAARRRDRHLGRRGRAGRRERPADRRGGHPGPGLALDLLGQRAGGPGRDGRILAAPARQPGPRVPA